MSVTMEFAGIVLLASGILGLISNILSIRARLKAENALSAAA